MFEKKLPEEIEKLLTELAEKYPRAASGIRLVWAQKEAEEFFETLLTYKENFDRDGFDMRNLLLIHKIKQEHDKIIEPKKQDIWNKAYEYVAPKRPKKG